MLAEPDSPLGYVTIDRAVSARLTFRSLAETTRDTLDWHAARPEDERTELRAGLAADRESELLPTWRAQR